MALPSSGVLSLSDFNTELGNAAGTTISLNDTAVRDLISKALDAQASFSEYYGASAASGSVNLVACSASSFTSGTATARLTAENDGETSGIGTTSLSVTDWWDSAPDAGIGSDYEIYVSVASGDTPTGTLNTWLSLSLSRNWTLSRSTEGQSTCTLTVQIRDTATSTVQGTATWTLLADVSTV